MKGVAAWPCWNFFLWQHAVDNFLLSYQFMMCDADSMLGLVPIPRNLGTWRLLMITF